MAEGDMGERGGGEMTELRRDPSMVLAVQKARWVCDVAKSVVLGK
jgi:hypothetical protein